MGGNNIHNLSGNDIYSYYIIKGFKNEISDELYIFGNEDIYHFTLEKFLEKYPFKIGDKVIDTADGCPGVVSEMKWDEDVFGLVQSEMKGKGSRLLESYNEKARRSQAYEADLTQYDAKQQAVIQKEMPG